MGIFEKNNSHHNIIQNGNNNIASQDNRTQYILGDGRECPFNWAISSGTCGICYKLETCRDGREWRRSLLKDMSDY
jgi:hypothetical protein